MNLILVADEKWNIGNKGDLLCHLSGDLKYFKKVTEGKTVVMGRKTLESLPKGKPLPNRENIVLTGNLDYKKDGAVIVNSEKELFDLIKNMPSDNVFLIGGGELYNRYYKLCKKCYITKIYSTFEADTKMANLDEDNDFISKPVSEILEENGIKYQMFEYENIKI